MYAIAFFTTVILFSASLYIGHKYVEMANRNDVRDTHADILINPSTHIGAFRKSA